MEKINITDYKAAAIILMNAICKDRKTQDKVFGPLESLSTRPDPLVDVELKVNGHDLSWTTVVDCVYSNYKEDVEKRATEKLDALLKGTKLAQFSHDLESVIWKMRDSAEKMLGEQIEWPSDY